MFKDILAGLQQKQPQQGFNPMMPPAMPSMMPMQAQQPVMTDPWGQQTGGVKMALMGRMMR